MKLKIEADSLKGLLTTVGIIVGLFALLSFTFFYKVLPFVTNKDKVVTVPDLNGMTLTEAINVLAIRDLGYEVTDSTYNSEVPPLTVLVQFPKPLAKVKVNRKINLKLNAKNPPRVAYPDFTGSTFDFAQRQLKSLDLKIGTIEYRPDVAHNAILESKITGTKVLAGQPIPKGSKIDLILGSPSNEFPLPDFTDMPFDDTEAYIFGMSLKIKELHSITDDNETSNTIQKQLPLAGDTVRHGDGVELWIYNLRKDE